MDRILESMAKALIESILSEDDKILKDPAWTIAVDNLGDSGITILIRPWVKAADYWDVKWRTLERIHDRLTEANIVFRSRRDQSSGKISKEGYTGDRAQRRATNVWQNCLRY